MKKGIDLDGKGERLFRSYTVGRFRTIMKMRDDDCEKGEDGRVEASVSSVIQEISYLESMGWCDLTLISRGSRSNVFSGSRTMDDGKELFVIKVTRDEKRSRCIKELRSLLSLQWNEGVPRVLDHTVDVKNGMVSIVMRMERMDLYEMISTSSRLERENIFIKRDDGDILVGDWGFAAKWSPFKIRTLRCGSKMYAADEIVTGSTYVGPEVDIFSMGLVLYTMLTGSSPYKFEVGGRTRNCIMKMQKLKRFDRDLISSMIERDPMRRYNMYDVVQKIKMLNTSRGMRKRKPESIIGCRNCGYPRPDSDEITTKGECEKCN